jgi:hypothetical protein
MVSIRAYSHAQIERSRQKILCLLREFPELWALRSKWGVHGWRDVKIFRAPAIHCLQDGIRPGPQMKSVKVYIVSDSPGVYDVTITDAGNRITAIGEHRIGDPDGLGLRQLVLQDIAFHCSAKEVMGNVPYLFLLEEGGDPLYSWVVTIVKPPIGQETFEKYITKIPRNLGVSISR